MGWKCRHGPTVINVLIHFNVISETGGSSTLLMGFLNIKLRAPLESTL